MKQGDIIKRREVTLEKGKGKGKFHPVTGYESPEGE
jgi:hypothetical protein